MSHYCEKARWGLERLGVDYYEERHLQVFHYPRTYWVSGGPNVPVLIDNKTVVHDSTAILKYLDRYAADGRQLYPQDTDQRKKVEELEDLFDEVVGVESRRWVYFHFRRRLVQAMRTAGQGAPWYEKLLTPAVYPVFTLLINTLIAPTSDNVESGLNKVRRIVKKTDALLANNNAYLLGNTFSAADLSLACMLAPLVLPGNYGIRLPERDELPEAAKPVVDEFRSSLTGEFVLKLYETERLTSATR
jgi:glutathione S-transferase